MKPKTTDGIPLRSYRLAKELIQKQARVPKSPAAVSADGHIELCAAACLAYAGLKEFVSEEEATEFATDVVTNRSFKAVENAFDRLEWPRSVCFAVLSMNDNAPDDVRQSVVADEFELRSRSQIHS